MPEHIRALIVILFLAYCFFFLAGKAVDPILQPGQFKLWRNSWFFITIAAFLAHNFWLYILLATLFLFYIAKKEQNRYALHHMLLPAIPLMSLRIPSLFDVHHARMLSLVILTPILLSSKLRAGTPKVGRPFADKLFIAFIILATILLMRGQTFTDSLRSGFNLFIDMFLPYYAASRIKDFVQLKAVIIAFVLASMVASLVGVFEFSSGWLLYNLLDDVLHANFEMGGYIARGNNLRANASLGNSIVLGFTAMMGMGFYLAIAPSITNKYLRALGYLLLAGGIISAIARGNWVGTAIIFLVFFATGKKVFKHFTLLFIVAVITIPVLPSLPGGQKIIDMLPFIGTTDQYNVAYRERLLEKSVIIIQRNPFFGVYDAREEPEMEDMKQGQGIIDIVNSYLGYVLSYGLVGLSLILGLFATALFSVRKSMKRIADRSSDEHLVGRSLFATMSAIIVVIFTTSSVGIIDTLYSSLIGMMVSYARIINQSSQQVKRRFI